MIASVRFRSIWGLTAFPGARGLTGACGFLQTVLDGLAEVVWFAVPCRVWDGDVDDAGCGSVQGAEAAVEIAGELGGVVPVAPGEDGAGEAF